MATLPPLQLDRANLYGHRRCRQDDWPIADALDGRAGRFVALGLLGEEDDAEQREGEVILLRPERAALAVAEADKLLVVPEDGVLDAPAMAVEALDALASLGPNHVVDDQVATNSPHQGQCRHLQQRPQADSLQQPVQGVVSECATSTDGEAAGAATGPQEPGDKGGDEWQVRFQAAGVQTREPQDERLKKTHYVATTAKSGTGGFFMTLDKITNRFHRQTQTREWLDA